VSLEESIQSLEDQRSSLIIQLDAQELTTEQIMSIQKFAKKVIFGISRAENDHELK
jgi:hypothetical protein